MEAKHDVTVTDHAGLTRKVFAGQAVPVELEGVYRQAVSDSKDEEKPKEAAKAKMETAPEVNKMEEGPEVSKAKTSSRRAK